MRFQAGVLPTFNLEECWEFARIPGITSATFMRWIAPSEKDAFSKLANRADRVLKPTHRASAAAGVDSDGPSSIVCFTSKVLENSPD
jgi:hypothetical protein